MRTLTPFAALLAAAGAALAVPPNPPPPQSSGPDVVVSGIGSSNPGVPPFGDSTGTLTLKNGSVGSVSAFSVGTISCNIGDAEAIWLEFENRHPVIGTQIYRYRTVNGAAPPDLLCIHCLNHGLCALDAANCAALVSPVGVPGGNPDCDWLGTFRTDTYSANLNANQVRLGPRSEINPWTGAYPYPYTIAFQQTGDAIYKRTQIPDADLVAGAQYIFEVVYIATDEPVANRYNNYAYRLADIAGSGASATFTLTGNTQSMQHVIDAWKALDPQVVKTTVDPSGTTDGRITIGSRVTQTGPSTWHYEYVVHNMNNDAAVRSFALPIDPAVSLSNVGFKDVAYHSGEPYDGTDWAFSSGGGAASWSTQTFAANPNANALRWSTAYSFRFDADTGPTNGSVTLGMFKTGASVYVPNIQVPAAPPPPTPGPFNLASPANGSTTANRTPTLSWSSSAGAATYDVKVATDSGLTSVVTSQNGLVGTSWVVPAAALIYNTQYFWGVTAVNSNGTTASTPAAFSFRTPPSPCAGDANGDGATNTLDLTLMLGNFGSTVPPNTGGDLDGNGSVNTADLTTLLGGFGCTS